MNKTAATILFLLAITCFSSVFAQVNREVKKAEQCATMTRLEAKFERNPSIKTYFDKQLQGFNRLMDQQLARPVGIDSVANVNNTAYTIPVVFHIVLPNPNVVTDAQIASQLALLNKNFAGSSADSVDIPSYFSSLFGKSGIQFCLAQRTPDNENTTGIDRVNTTKTSFSPSTDGVKHKSSGGTDIWNGDKYFNVWICVLSDDLLGYATFPNDGAPLEQGVVIDYRSLPGGSFTNYNGGKTLTHETGHYFNLFHIWGDDDGTCNGSDFVGDTPNQGNSSSGCSSGIRTDNCTSAGNGILYQDYMDYSYDRCLLLFTPLQVARMEAALLTYRSSLIVSDGCTPIVNKTLDARLRSIDVPAQRICTPVFTPIVNITNRGNQTLTSLVISTVLDNGVASIFNWNGTLASLSSVLISLNPITISEGTHTIKIFVSRPNQAADENTTNDTLTTTVQYFNPVTTVSEGFEGSIFPPTGWDIVNPDNGITWKKVTGISKTGTGSVSIGNFDYSYVGEQDYLRMPQANLAGVDSAFLTFQLAAATFTRVTTANNAWDTLEVLVSTDCGINYTSVYKKWGASLVTTTSERTVSFVPTASEWRKDSINLTAYANAENVLVAFRNTTGYENNIYLDDINLRTVAINPNLKKAGFLVTPNPTSGNVNVQFYPNPTDLKAVQLYNMTGQKLAETVVISGQFSTLYSFNLGRYASGAYVVRAVFSDRVVVRKIIKN